MGVRLQRHSSWSCVWPCKSRWRDQIYYIASQCLEVYISNNQSYNLETLSSSPATKRKIKYERRRMTHWEVILPFQDLVWEPIITEGRKQKYKVKEAVEKTGSCNSEGGWRGVKRNGMMTMVTCNNKRATNRRWPQTEDGITAAWSFGEGYDEFRLEHADQ